MSEMRAAETGNLGDILDPGVPAERTLIIDVREDGSSEAITAGAFDADANAVARALSARGFKRGASVAILANNRPDYLIAYMGIMRAGLVPVPISSRLGADTIAFILQDSSCVFAFVDGERRAMVEGRLPLADFDGAEADGFEAFLDAGPFTSATMRSEEWATILYTSGSTGRPKGVPLTHGGYLWATGVFEHMRPIAHGQPVLVAAPLFHMNALFYSKLLFRLGAINVLMRRFTARGYIRAIEEHRCVLLTSVPTMLALVAKEKEALASADLSSVRMVTTGSAPVTQGLMDKIKEIFPGAETSVSFGTTESGPVAFGPHPQGLRRPDTSLGYPSPGVEVRLVGGETPDEGVLHIRTQAMMPGYLNLPDITAKRLQDGWYDTGDIMRRDENGFYFFVGRADDMFVCGGENIYPGEVEKLLERHPAVHQAAVVPVPDEVKGQLPVAYVVRVPGQPVSEEDIKQFALSHGPAYAHPRAVFFIEELPLAGTNKIDRKALIARAAKDFTPRS
ncbi:class I adenylate-forming enzyme family protein [Rhodoligotrophos defluvii]|uniref:class I adenylate-forming enzyme family protein n=1 Tax=Rhodoligotrophos defluvii TaxID=2561934 RepID=UPI001EF01F07|nr:class I adenylate-forming enzyme family protein [Rhodoligotrophos defluvii]